MSVRAFRRLVLPILAVAGLVAGCGGGGSSSAAPTPGVVVSWAGECAYALGTVDMLVTNVKQTLSPSATPSPAASASSTKNPGPNASPAVTPSVPTLIRDTIGSLDFTQASGQLQQAVNDYQQHLREVLSTLQAPVAAGEVDQLVQRLQAPGLRQLCGT